MATIEVNYQHDKKEAARAQKEIRRRLEELGGKLYDDDDVTYQGNRLILPENMDLKGAIGFLEKKRQEMEKETVFSRTFNYRPWDGAWCMWQALKRVFGIVGHQETVYQTMFGPQVEPPAMITINVDVDKQEQIPWGTFALPMFPGLLFQTETGRNDFGNVFMLYANGPKKYKAAVEGIFTLIELELKERSMYRGRAFDGQQFPEFVDLSAVDPRKVVYSQEVMTQLEANVWAQLRHTAEFERLGIPLKRAVLVHGPYGTGKTLAATLTGQEAVANGWTFIKARPGRDDLGEVMQTARLYQPSVVFYEDIDQVAAPEAGGHEAISRLLDDFDGVSAKGTRILCILTTNHPERIHKGMVRPGRLDAMIEINDLDVEGVAKLVQSCIEESLADGIDWDAVFEAAEGYKPAFVTELSTRAVRYLIARMKGSPGDEKVTTEDLVHAAVGLRPQYDKMTGARDTQERHELADVLGREVTKAATIAVRENVQDRLLDPAKS